MTLLSRPLTLPWLSVAAPAVGGCEVCHKFVDNNLTLLCDTCDSEYHIYCLEPPLKRLPRGDWHCPACILKRGRRTSSGKGRRSLPRDNGGMADNSSEDDDDFFASESSDEAANLEVVGAKRRGRPRQADPSDEYAP